VVVGSRQTLLSTYLFYQALAYLGRDAVHTLAALETQNRVALRHSWGLRQQLGGIEVLVAGRGGRWQKAGELYETGPLASDVKLVLLPDGAGRAGGRVRVRLRLTRGHWRLDYLALAKLGARVQPVRLEPAQVSFEPGPYRQPGAPAPVDADGTRVTLPGDAFTFTYRLPDEAARYELFLESRGYYLEWLRDEWMREEDPRRVAMLRDDPERALRELAPAFKEHEPQMEAVFWNSRYVRR
jgi:hypothetical protein